MKINSVNPLRSQRTEESGFSLLELLAAMAILMIIVMMISLIFSESNKTWTIGIDRMDNNSAGRATLDLITHDLQYAVADSNLTFMMRPDTKRTGVMSSYSSWTNSEICFVSLQDASSRADHRTAREMHYYVREDPSAPHRYQLMRGYWSPAIVTDPTHHCYGTTNWWDPTASFNPGADRPPVPPPDQTEESVMLAENIGGLGFFYEGLPDYDSRTNNLLPEYVDVWLEVINDRQANQLSDWFKRNAKDNVAMVERNARRYTARVYFQNRRGYMPR
jgi:hypothetical protein